MSTDPSKLPPSAQPPSDDEDSSADEPSTQPKLLDVDEKESEQLSSKGRQNATDSSANNVACAPHTFTATAHNKMVLHALKYITRPVIGLLIGYAYKAEKSRANIHVMDCIPLLHNTFSSMVVELAFLQIESWLSSLNELNSSKSSRKLQIVGVYYANEFSADTSKLSGAVLIYEQLIQQFNQDCVVLCQIDNERIEATCKGEDVCSEWFVLKPNGTTKNPRGWRNVDNMTLVQSELSGVWQKKQSQKGVPSTETTQQYQKYLADLGALATIEKLSQLNLKSDLEQKKDEQINDFEDHLDNTAKDWRNLHL